VGFVLQKQINAFVKEVGVEQTVEEDYVLVENQTKLETVFVIKDGMEPIVKVFNFHLKL
jgi:ribulose 1,5-bisphosphate synthetase/thiazole synthase